MLEDITLTGDEKAKQQEDVNKKRQEYLQKLGLDYTQRTSVNPKLCNLFIFFFFFFFF
jgi:hypothetical protein